jgi:cytochrome c-type biogenesis protein CcmE
MYGKKVKLRALFISLFLVSVILSIFLVLKSLEENVVYFLSPTEIKNLSEINNRKIRIGGMVKNQSIIINSDKVIFIVTDFKNEISVSYSGLVPNLFEEGKGVVAEGFLKDRSFLVADKILAKHDENYMPPEVKEALEGK